METANVSTPAEDFKKDLQMIEQRLSILRYNIDSGTLSSIYEYKNMLLMLYRKLRCWIDEIKKEEVETLSNSIKIVSGLKQTFNHYTQERYFCINNVVFPLYLENLTEFEYLLRECMKKQNFLVKVIEKKTRLT